MLGNIREMATKTVYIIAGPNGSGKTTFAKEFLSEVKIPFVNADEIAMKLSGLDVRKVRLTAGKLFFQEIQKHLSEKRSFALETTLAGNYLVDFIKDIKRKKYYVKLVYILVESIDEALRRIDIRIKKGGHAVPPEDVRRRFGRSKNNFWNMYRFLVNDWEMYLNSKDEFLQVAVGEGKTHEILNEDSFSIFMEGVR